MAAVTTVNDRTSAVQQVPAVATLFVPPANAEHLMTAVWSLRSAGIGVVAGGASAESILPFRDVGCQCLVAANPADLINQTWNLHRLPVLVVADAVTVPDNFLGRALVLLADDLRVAYGVVPEQRRRLPEFPREERSERPPPGGT